MFKIVAAALALYSYLLIETSQPQLPSRIPTHFNFAGKPDRWGSPHVLWILLGIQVLIAVLMLSIPILGRKFPGTVHLGTRRLSDYTPEQREVVMPLLEQMAGVMSVATSLFFVYLIREMIAAAEQPRSNAYMGWAAVLFAATLIGLSLFYSRRMNRVAKSVQPK